MGSRGPAVASVVILMTDPWGWVYIGPTVFLMFYTKGEVYRAKGPPSHPLNRWSFGKKTIYFTPRKINMEPENTPLEKENHLPNHHFQVLC